jgi:Zn-dependent protease with chaperone function
MNTIKTGFLLALLTLILLVGGQLIAGQQGLTFALIIAVVMNFSAYFWSDKIALAMSGARPVDRAGDERGAAGNAAAGPTDVSPDGGPVRADGAADAAALRDSSGAAERLRHRAQPAEGGYRCHRRAARNHERR